MSEIKEVFGKQYRLKVVSNDRPIMVKAVGDCIFTKVPYETAKFPLMAFNSWLGGSEHIQTVDGLKELSADDREFLISCTGPLFWKQIEKMENE
jgi:hypothetical protein